MHDTDTLTSDFDAAFKNVRVNMPNPPADAEEPETKPPSTDVLNVRTGELVDLRAAEPEQLAQLHVDSDDHISDLRDFQAAVSDELVRRLDRRGEWTWHLLPEGAGYELEVKAASPSAGTETYPPADLKRELLALLDEDAIDVEAADAALVQTVTIQVTVPITQDPAEVVKALKASTETEIAGVPVTIASVDASTKSVAAGINRLKKIPAAAGAVARACTVLPTPARKATVKVKVAK